MSTFRKRSDPSCILLPEDHEWIKTKSFIDYTFCRLQPVAAIERSVANGAAHVQPNASDEVIQRIVDGARKTRQISGFVISALDG